ncbi:MAG: hypothetical protein EOM12_13505, partial [Verrucomicrobiae bacterium]|nr:hypothetical protein [Verrucomicrobiae bacterium]
MAYHVTRTYKIGNDIYDVPEHEEEAFRKSLVKEKGTDTAVEPIHTFKDADKTYDVPESELPEFHKAFGDKQPERINVYKSDDGEIYDVPESEHDDFRLASGMLPQYSGPKSPGAQRQKSPQKSTVVDNISTTVHDASGASGTDSLINDPLTA